MCERVSVSVCERERVLLLVLLYSLQEFTVTSYISSHLLTALANLTKRCIKKQEEETLSLCVQAWDTLVSASAF